LLLLRVSPSICGGANALAAETEGCHRAQNMGKELDENGSKKVE
jgi:hypothetical protein